ncbi:MAG: hypothetical protein N3D73_01190 [Candidatus Diapherotrites archaeon]|nr:hypothetical protein [Candidatus Diapherotrites archaeon]
MPTKKTPPAKRTVSKEFMKIAKEYGRIPSVQKMPPSARRIVSGDIKYMLITKRELAPEEKRLIRKLRSQSEGNKSK